VLVLDGVGIVDGLLLLLLGLLAGGVLAGALAPTGGAAGDDDGADGVEGAVVPPPSGALPPLAGGAWDGIAVVGCCPCACPAGPVGGAVAGCGGGEGVPRPAGGFGVLAAGWGDAAVLPFLLFPKLLPPGPALVGGEGLEPLLLLLGWAETHKAADRRRRARRAAVVVGPAAVRETVAVRAMVGWRGRAAKSQRFVCRRRASSAGVSW
jgi:hypothetical protein